MTSPHDQPITQSLSQGRALLTELRDRPAQVMDAILAADHPAFAPLLAMRGCPQATNHHSEGDVWTHTALALSVFADLPAQVEHHAGVQLDAAFAAAKLNRLPLPAPTVGQALAVLLHDVAKPVTIAGPDGAWTYYGHPRAGAQLARDLVADLDLVAAGADLGITVEPDRLAWLVDEHLFWLTTDIAKVRHAAVARRCVRDDGWDEDLRVLAWCDTLGSRAPDGRPHTDLMVRAEVRLGQARAHAAALRARPAPLLDGRTVMAALGLASGPAVGEVLRRIRAQASTQAEAQALLAVLAQEASDARQQ